MTITGLNDLLVQNRLNPRLAVRALSTEEKISILPDLYRIVEPIKSTCHDVSSEDLKNICLMCECYNQYLIETGNGKFTRARSTACSLPQSLSHIQRFLKMSGKLA